MLITLVAAFVASSAFADPAPEAERASFTICGTVSGTPEYVLVYNERLGRYAAATRYTGELADHVTARMEAGDAVYIIRDALGNELAGFLHNGRLDGTFECKCVGTGGLGGICPGLPNCPPIDCANDTQGAKARCKSVKIVNP